MHLLLFFIALVAQAGSDASDMPQGSEAAASEPGVDEGMALGDDEGENPLTGLVAEPQVPTGKFTTATEIRPILGATRANWVAVREYEGKDLVYFTHLWAWRCGLVQMRFSVNGDEPAIGRLPPCHENEAQPNAIKAEDGLPFVSYTLGSVQQVTVTIVYDDLEQDSITVDRVGVLLP